MSSYLESQYLGQYQLVAFAESGGSWPAPELWICQVLPAPHLVHTEYHLQQGPGRGAGAPAVGGWAFVTVYYTT